MAKMFLMDAGKALGYLALFLAACYVAQPWILEAHVKAMPSLYAGLCGSECDGALRAAGYWSICALAAMAGAICALVGSIWRAKGVEAG